MQNPYLQNRQPVVFESQEPSLTDGSHQKACDIHHIINQYDKTGLISHINENTPQNIDHTQLPTFQQLLDINTQLNQQFDQLPSKLKKRFKNKEELNSFLLDTQNYDEAVKLGLVKPIPQEDAAAQPTKQASASVTTNSTETNNQQ